MSSAITPSCNAELFRVVVNLLFETWDAATQRAILLLDKHNYAQLRHRITRVRATTAACLDTLPALTHVKLLLMADYDGSSDLATRLHSRSVGRGPPADLAPLAGCSLLQELDLQDMTITDLEPLAGLTRLHTLDLESTAAMAMDAAGNAPTACVTRHRMVVVHDAEDSEDEAILVGMGISTAGAPRPTVNIELAPLRRLTQLQTLRLGSAAVANLRALTGLTQLETLSCEATGVSHLGPLSTCTRLVHLNLDGNPGVTNLTPLKALHMLQSLSLARTRVRDLAPIKDLAHLQFLSLRGASEVEDLRPIAKLARLQVLNLDSTGVHDLRPVAGLTLLSRLSFVLSPVQDIGPLAGLLSLETLVLWADDVRDMRPVLSLTKLRSLKFCSENDTALDLAQVTRLTQLVELDVQTGLVVITAPLIGLACLEVLRLYYTGIWDLAPLACLTTLTTLVVTGSRHVRDLAPLAALTRLRGLTVEDSRASCLRPLSSLTRLTALCLNNTGVLWDLRPLAGLTGLEELNLMATSVSDLRPISLCTRLQRLWLGNTRVTQLGPIRALRQLQLLFLSNTPVRDLTPLGQLHPVSSTARRARRIILLTGFRPAGWARRSILRLMCFRPVASPPDAGDAGPVTSLLRLDLDETLVQDVAPLAACTQLTHLSLDKTAVWDVAPLASLSQLRYLGLQGTRTYLRSLAPLAGLTHLHVWWSRPVSSMTPGGVQSHQ